MNFSNTLRFNVTLSISKLLCFAYFFTCFSLNAIEHVIAHAPLDDKDKLQEYSFKLLTAALEITIDDFGTYTLTRASESMSRDRQFMEVSKGERLTVIASPPIKKWRNDSLRVAFPIDKGISSYRIFFLLKKNHNLFENITTLDELKKISTGSNQQWSTTQILKDSGFNLVTGITYQGLFAMLNSERFLTFNRGINEILIESEVFGSAYPNLTFDKHIALFTYLPNYFFVSPKYPILAKRITNGLHKLHNNGELDKLFDEYFGQYIKKINLENRRFFYIENTNLGEDMYQ